MEVYGNQSLCDFAAQFATHSSITFVRVNIYFCIFFCLWIHRYLCGYAYYTSLYQNPTCSAFIHVPPLGGPYSAQQLALGIREALLSMLKQISPEDS